MKHLLYIIIATTIFLSSCKEDMDQEVQFIIETNLGNMKGKLYNGTPKHRDNFMKLANDKYYHDLLFHRVIKGFMIQGGDPDSKIAEPEDQLGGGGPGYTIEAEFDTNYTHKRGALAAARLGGPSNPKKRSSGSQFYIVHGKTWSDKDLKMIEKRAGKKWTAAQKEIYKKQGGYPPLDQDYTVFGEIIEGLDVLEKIAAVQIGRADRPVEDVEMKITLIRP
jgi:peptidyl-prolyl cis-trans isomerase B (cyclophilin B)